MNCRITLGVVIGVLNILLYIASIVLGVIFLQQVYGLKERHPEQNEIIEKFNTTYTLVVVTGLIMTLISSILIIGIVKRSHNLMLPWLILTAIGFVINCGRLLIDAISDLVQGVRVGAVVFMVFIGLLLLAIAAAIWYFMFTLYRDMRKGLIQKPERLAYGGPVGYQMPNNYDRA